MQCLSLFRLGKRRSKVLALTYGYFEHMKFEVGKHKLKYINYSSIPESKYSTILEQVSEGDNEKEHKLKVLFLEVELLRQEGVTVPEEHEMEPKHYSELLKLNSRTGRKKYLQFLFKLCRKNENRLLKKREKALELEKMKEQRIVKDLPLEEFAHTYDLQHNNIFLRFRDKTINNFYNNNLMKAMQFGQKLIIDCGYHEKMTDRENINCAKQLMLLFGENRIHSHPFDLHYCNFDRNSILGKSLANRIATLYDLEFPLNIHQQSYTELFPKEKLIYLTPHCKAEMQQYDHDALYIIGAIVDKMNQEPLSMAKAKQENIRMMKFPLDQYLLWSGGSGKSLTLNQVVSILLDVKETGNWKYALRHVPSRKLAQQGNDQLEMATKNLLKRKTRWTPAMPNLNHLSFSRNNEKWGQPKNKKRLTSVSSLFSDNLYNQK